MMAVQVVLKQRPNTKEGEALVVADHFEVQPCTLPSPPPADSITVRLLWLSVDPYLRCRFNASTGVDYTDPFVVGEPIRSAAVGIVESSTLTSDADVETYPVGALVHGLDLPWAEYFHCEKSSGASARALGGFPTRVPAPLLSMLDGDIDKASRLVLGLLGVPGLTAYFGLQEAFGGRSVADLIENGLPTPQCLIVSSVAGATGSTVAALAKLVNNLRVVGITSREAKAQAVSIVVDQAVCYALYPADEEGTELSKAVETAAAGVPITAYFDSVGGFISTQVFHTLQEGATVVLCGQISSYDKDESYPPPLSARSAAAVEARQLKRERYLVLKYAAEFEAAQAHLAQLHLTGQIEALDTVVDGLSQSPQAMIGVMTGSNVGKMLVRVAGQP